MVLSSNSASKMFTQAINKSKARIVDALENLHESLQDLTTAKQVQTCTKFHTDTGENKSITKTVLKGRVKKYCV